MEIDQIKSAEVFTGDKATAKLLDRDNSDEFKSNGAACQGGSDGDSSVQKMNVGTKAGSEVPDAAELQRLAESVGVEWQEGLADRVVPYWASDERVDRQGDIVRQNFDFADFDKNPVMPFNHQWNEMPVGSIIRHEVRQRSDADYTGPALHTLNVFATEEQSPFADSVFRMVRGGFMPGSSIGFRPKTVIDVKDPEERAALGLGPWGLILDDNILLEHSPTTIPANPGAVAVLNSMKAAGELKAHDVIAIRELQRGRIVAGEGDLRKWLEMEAVTLSVWKCLFPDARLEVHKDLDVPLVLDADAVNRVSESEKKIAALAEEMKALRSEVEKTAQASEDQGFVMGQIHQGVEQLKDAMGDYVAAGDTPAQNSQEKGLVSDDAGDKVLETEGQSTPEEGDGASEPQTEEKSEASGGDGYLSGLLSQSLLAKTENAAAAMQGR